ncbi:MAG: hypothetical protein HYX53_15735 [Chloroflexi bacterium]|nr:hypothetical protein [Chloroflexota bacterium]
MPTYEYHCKACGANYDLRQGFDAEITHACEECHKGTAKRVLHAPRVVFKGSGFYVTDSKKAGSTLSDAKSSGGDSVPGEAAKTEGASAATESKPAEPRTSSPKSSGDSAPAAAG